MSPTSRGEPKQLAHQVAALERTALSWQRTAFSLGAVGALLLKVVEGGRALQAAGVALVGLAIVIVLVLVPLGYRRTRLRVDPDRPPASFTAPDRWRAPVLLGTAVAVSLTVLAVAVDLWVTGAA